MTGTVDATVVVVTYNGADRIGPCLSALRSQQYPTDRYEIVVVDDGSDDATAATARAAGARVVRHDLNRGIPVARNTGIRAASGAVVCFVDDDCVADPTWLPRVLAEFDDPRVAAVGGRVDAVSSRHLAQKYLLATGYGNPASLGFGRSRHPLSRFLTYLDTMYRPVFLTEDVTEVQSAYTANIAYRADVLAELGGFDATLMSDEDVDLSHRLRAAGHRILFVPDARILHRHHERLRLFVRQVYRRSRNTLRFYRKAGKTPPIFPLPVAWALLAVAGVVLSVTSSAWWLASTLVTPPLLYNWWIYRSIRERQVPYLVFPYAQLCVEGAAIAGLFAGGLTTPVEGGSHA